MMRIAIMAFGSTIPPIALTVIIAKNVNSVTNVLIVWSAIILTFLKIVTTA